MGRLFRHYLGIAFLRQSPADLPAGAFAVVLAVVLATVVYVVVGSFGSTVAQSISRSVLDLTLNAVLLAGTLVVCGRPERFSQAFSAVCGSGAVVNLAALPLMWRIGQLPEGVEPGGGYLLPWLLLMGWLVAVQAHILGLTLEIGRGPSITLAIGYLLVALIVFDRVFGG